MQWKNNLICSESDILSRFQTIIIFMSTRGRKVFYILLTGALTSTTVTAAYWQTSRYFQAQNRWKMISQQLSVKNPPLLSALTEEELHALKYISVDGETNGDYMLISRARESRMGWIIVRPIFFKEEGEAGQQKCILAVEGWIPEQYDYTPKKESRIFKGILREKQKTDYLHKKMKQTDIDKFNINTFIDVERAAKEMKLENRNLITEYYFQILKEENSQDYHYPYQYSVDNFQLPYLTPDKHRAYAMFWGLTSMVGFTAIFKTLRMK